MYFYFFSELKISLLCTTLPDHMTRWWNLETTVKVLIIDKVRKVSQHSMITDVWAAQSQSDKGTNSVQQFLP